MNRKSTISSVVIGLAAMALFAIPTTAFAAADNLKEVNRFITISLFVAIIIGAAYIVTWAAKQTKNTNDFYAAGNSITGAQNGWAIAGDFNSTPAFLGVAGIMTFFGFDGLFWCFGPMMAFLTALFLIAEPCRNLGKYTVGDILTFRTSPIPVRAIISVVTVTLSVMYMLVQLVGAGKLMQLLLGIPYMYSVVAVGVVMVAYVMVGGMIATTWLQIVKAMMLVTGAFVLFILVCVKVGFNPVELFNQVTESPYIREWVQTFVLKHPVPQAGFDYGQRFTEPGLFMPNVWDQIANSIGFLLGAAAMPHILMRFFTVPNAREARKSVWVCILVTGGFFMMIAVIGYGSALNVTPQTLFSIDRGGNMANLLLAKLLGTELIASWVGDFLMAYICAVAFATIVAVVAGIVLAGASGISHDLWVNVIRKGHADPHEQLTAAKITSVFIGAVGIWLALNAESQNVAHIGIIAFGVAASGNFPAIILTLFWKKMSTAGVIGAVVFGTFSAVFLVLVSPTMEYPKVIAANAQKTVVALEQKVAGGVALTERETASLATARKTYEANKDKTSMMGLDAPWYPHKNPGITSVPIGFAAAIIFSLLFPRRDDEAKFEEVYVRQMTGIGAHGTVLKH